MERTGRSGIVEVPYYPPDPTEAAGGGGESQQAPPGHATMQQTGLAPRGGDDEVVCSEMLRVRQLRENSALSSEGAV